MIVTNAWEEVMFNLEIQTERDIEGKLRVLGKVHAVLALSCGPALEVLGLGSPFLHHAWNMANLRESNKNGTNTKHVCHPKRNSGQTEPVGKIRNGSNVANEAHESIWRDLRVALDLAHITTEDGLVFQEAVSVVWPNNER